MTYVLLSYLGVSTLWHLVDAWRQLAMELDAARSFEAVYAAGESFGKRIGAQVARVLLMLVTWALGNTLDGAIPKAASGAGAGEASAPGATTAARMLVTEARGVLAVPPASAVRAVSLGEGRVTFAFASGEVDATEQAAIRSKAGVAQKPSRPQQRSPVNAKRVPLVAQGARAEEPEDGNWHHIATNKNADSELRGGP